MEATPGTPVAASKIMQSMMILPKAGAQFQTALPQGGKFPVGLTNTEQWTELPVTLNTPSHGELCYLYASALGLVTPTAVGANGVYKWVFTENQLAADTRQTFTVEHGTTSRGRQFAFAIVDQLGLKFTRKGISGTANLKAQTPTDPFTLTALTTVPDVQTVSISGAPTGGTFAPTFKGQTTAAIPYNATAAQLATALNALSTIAGGVTCTGGPLPTTPIVVTFAGLGGAQPLLTATDSFTGGTSPATSIAHTTTGVAVYPEYPLYPLQPNSTNLFIDSNAASLGTTQMQRGFEFDVSKGTMIAPVFALNSGASYAGFVETENNDAVTLVLEADSAGEAYLSQYTQGSTIFVRCLETGKTIDGMNNYSHQFDCAVKLDKAFEWANTDNVFTIKYQGRIFFDPSWNNALQVTVQNTLPSL